MRKIEEKTFVANSKGDVEAFELVENLGCRQTTNVL